jgi:predicted transcriptional regulator
MVTIEEKQELIKWVENLDNESLLRYIMELKESTINSDKIYQLTERERKAVEEGLEDFRNGRVLSHEEVMRQTRAKFPQLFLKDKE